MTMKNKKTIKTEPLDKSYRNTYDDLYDYIEERLKPIRKRYAYVVGTILKTFGISYKPLHFDFGTIDSTSVLSDTFIFFDYAAKTKNKTLPTSVYNKIEYYLGESFPSRWMFEDFEPELQKIHEDWVKQQKEDKVSSKQEAKKLQAIKKKLSPEEFEFVAQKIKK